MQLILTALALAVAMPATLVQHRNYLLFLVFVKQNIFIIEASMRSSADRVYILPLATAKSGLASSQRSNSLRAYRTGSSLAKTKASSNRN